MRDLNKVILIGRLGMDPIQRETRSGAQVTNFPVATSRRLRVETSSDAAPGELEETIWHRVVVWNKQAEHCAQYLKKGSPVYVEGSIRTRRYQDKDGAQRMAFEIHADNIGFLGGAPRRMTMGDGLDGVTDGEQLTSDEVVLEHPLAGAATTG